MSAFVILVYGVTIVLFMMAAMVAPLPFFILIGICRRRAGDERTTLRSPLWPPVISAILLMMLVQWIWGKVGLEPGWALIGILLVWTFLTPGKTEAAQTNAYGTMIGLIIYGILSSLKS